MPITVSGSAQSGREPTRLRTVLKPFGGWSEYNSVGWFGLKGSSAAGRRGKRREERFHTDLLTSTLGDVVDLSGTGVRVRKTGRPGVVVGQVMPVTLRSDQCHVTLKSRVVRIKRNGLRECEIGLAFVEIRPGLRNALHHLARFGFIPNLDKRGGGEHVQPEKKHKSAIPDYYGLLKISPTATDDQVRVAYHEAARRYHPDANRSADRVFMFEAVSEAYRILRDPHKRREYDQRRTAAHAA
jgi:hypothetical protein